MLYDDPQLYDELLPVSAEHLAFYTGLAERHDGGVLELACGSGQLLTPLARTCPEAYGLDHSPRMLEAAARRAEAAGAKVELVEGDMRDFDLGRQFSLIFVARHSLLHLIDADDYRRFFGSVARHLRPGGVLAFDIFNPDLRELTRPSGERTQFLRTVTPSYGELVVEETEDYDPIAQVNRATWYVSANGRPDAWVMPVHLRMIFPQELPLLLAANGFRLLRRDGDLTGGDLTATSARQVCVCEPV